MWFDIPTRSTRLEILDGDDFDQIDLRKNLREIELVNKRLGGHTSSCNLLKPLLAKLGNQRLRIVDLGCGSGDTIRSFRKRWPQHQYIGVDLNSTAIDMAQNADTSHADAYLVENIFDMAITADIAHMAMVNHHFSFDQNVEIVKKLVSSKIKFILVNDLHRSYLALAGISLLTHVLPTSIMVKHDAPLSVRRAYSKLEWMQILDRAGVKKFTINWGWAFRYLIVIDNR